MFNKKRSFADITFNSLVGLFIRKSAEMVSFLKYVISACDFIFASVVWWDTDALTPIVGWKRVNAAVSHEGKLTNFKCHAEIARGKQDMLSGDIKFAIKPTIDIMVAAQTPFSGYKNVKV
jgi:hypothetical protein